MKHFFLFLLGTALIVATILRVRHGGGDPYPDISSPPLVPDSELELMLSYPEPVGNVAVSATGRIFFTVHPESRPRGNKLLEWVDGAAVPYPNGTVQPHLFGTVLGLVVDRHNRLWTVDHGNHGFGKARLLAFDLESGMLVHEHAFRPETAPAGSFLQDLQVSADGGHVFIADASFWRKRPAIIVYDATTRRARRTLESHPSVSAMNFLVRNHGREMKFLGGLVALRGGVDGIAIDAANEWLYFAAISGDGLYRVPVSVLVDPAVPPQELEARVERYSNKPLSDGLSTDLAGNVYVTDVEHGSVFIVEPDRLARTLLRSDRIRWADGLSFGPGGWLYVADSAIADQILQTREHIRAAGPYFVFRFRPGHDGIPGH